MRDLLRRQDDAFVAFARELTEDEWRAPSLCAGWTNQDVLAHLVLGLRLPASALLAATVLRRSSFDTANDRLSREHAVGRGASDLLDEFDRRRKRPRGIGRLLPLPLLLGDHTVHHLDIALALGRTEVLDAEVADAVLDVEIRIPNPFVPAARRARGLCLLTTDTEWSRPGDRSLAVRGPAEALVSTLAGRPHALPRLHGAGVAVLATRI
ncbi:maleylpyruvate isomerase family mycothiol-dependent enzyme [Streptomyces nodosus]